MTEGESIQQELTRLEKLRESYIIDLTKIDDRIELLKLQIIDEQEGKSVITSDTEFDDQSVDPRYEHEHYGANKIKPKIEKKPIVPQQPRSNVSGFYKGGDTSFANTAVSAKNEALQKMKVEKQIKTQNERINAFRSTKDTATAISALATSLQVKRESLKISEQKQIEEESNEPIRYGFDISGIEVGYKLPIKSEKYHSDGYVKEQDPAYDKYSHQYMAMRYMPEDYFIQELGETKVYRPSSLIREVSVRQNYFNHTNYIVVGIVVEKSDSTFDKGGNSKSMRLKISDFVYDIIVYLRGEAYVKYWKLQPGAMIAILNPALQDRYYKKDGKFVNNANDFTLRVDNDSGLLEYARSRDFAICSAPRCKSYADTRKSRFCEYHKEKNADKAASKRMEMGSGYKTFAPVDIHGNKQAMIMTVRQIEDLELLNEHKNNTNRTGGLAIENVNPNPPFREKNYGGDIVTDFTHPKTQENTKTQEEMQSEKHKNISRETMHAFLATNYKRDKKTAKEAILKQEKNKKLDIKLKKMQMEYDYELQKKQIKSLQARELKKRKMQEGQDLIKKLYEASKTEKTLRKDRNTINTMKREREEVEEHLKEYRINKKRNAETLGDHIEVVPKPLSTPVSTFSSIRNMAAMHDESDVDLGSSDSDEDY